MRGKREKPKMKPNKDKLEKFFTQAHINQGENKNALTIYIDIVDGDIGFMLGTVAVYLSF